MWISRCIVFLTMIKLGEGVKILGLFPFPGTSHVLLNLLVVKELARRGHEVTVYSPSPEKQPIPNYTNHQIDMKEEYLMQRIGYDINMARKTNSIIMLGMALTVGEHICEITMKDASIQKLLRSTEHYDLIVMEVFFMDCLLMFAHKFKTPVVQICAFGGTSWMGDSLGNPTPYSYVPNPYSRFTDRMNFWERTMNLLGETAFRIGMYSYYVPKQDAIISKYYSNQTEDLPSVYQLRTSVSLALFNSHFSISYPKPLMPNMIQVGGMHIRPPQKLPKDVQEFLDGAEHGAIYFSMGSTVMSRFFPEEKKKIFLQVFSELKQKVLWKFEDDSLPYKPSNLKVGKWLPQSDILAHPNVRVFITHGGLLSCQESIARGVPVIGIPMFGDQVLNVERAVRGGYGVLLDSENITVTSLTWALREVLDNQRYSHSAKRMSKIFLDQPLSPLELAMYWIEYVIRHNGTSHLRSAAVDLYWYQYFLLDVIGFLLLCFITLLLISVLVLRSLLRMIRREAATAVAQTKIKSK